MSPMSRKVLAAVLAAVVMMAWGTAFWMGTGIPKSVIKHVGNEDAAIAMLKQSFPESGAYFLPNCPDDMKDAAWQAKVQSGPLAQVFITHQGMDPNMTKSMLIGFVHALFSALIAICIMKCVLGKLDTYKCRVTFITMLGVFGAFTTYLADAVWMHRPWDFTLMYMGFYIVQWFLAGLVIGKIVDPAKMPSCCPMKH